MLFVSNTLIDHLIDQVFNNSAVYEYADGIAVHWYTDELSTTDGLEETHDLFPDKFILSTEACNGTGNSNLIKF